MTVTRRGILAMTPVAACSVSAFAQQSAPATSFAGIAEELYPTHSPELVREIVGAAHARLDRVRELVGQHPALARAAWDWGFGDWETALGAASHTGQREIAKLLIDHGARPDIFTFAMLGNVEVVRAYVGANPGIQKIHGPHGITLLKHAKAGGEKAAEVVAYLTQLGDSDVGQIAVPVPAEWVERYLGEYSYGNHPNDRFVVAKARNGFLTICRKGNGSPRNLCYQGEHAFQPAGAQQVKIRFEIRESAVTGLSIVDGPMTRSAARVA